jgi:hypothetical protein
VKYEIRKWSDQLDCLYTDDRRVKDLALRSRDLTIVASYFRTSREPHPFAWDIVGPRSTIGPIARRFGRQSSTVLVRHTT